MHGDNRCMQVEIEPPNPSSVNDNCTPPLKWAGGKRWFVERYRDAIPRVSCRYLEPFFGSGAVFFSIETESAVISDINKPLMETYKAIRDRPVDLTAVLRIHHNHHSESYYYKVRELEPSDEIEKAARFIYLNRVCWNGLYRENLNGKFNVPIGTKKKVLLPTDDFVRLSVKLSKAEILSSDFADVIASAGEGDFLFVDPPYVSWGSSATFRKYTAKVFSWDDQIRLRDALVGAHNRGAQFILTNSANICVMNLYREFEFKQVVGRSNVLAAKTDARGEYKEFVVGNYEWSAASAG